jgi:hypothetical protein
MKKTPFFACIAILLLAGCEKEVEVVDLTVGWTIGLESPDSDMCSRAGIKDIHVSLHSPGDEYERYGTCTTGVVSFENIPRTGYEIEVSGLNDDGCPVYYGSSHVPSSDVILGYETLRLESLPSTGTVSIGWWFSDGRFCSYHDVDDVRIIIFKDDIEVINYEVACEDGLYTIEEALTGRYSIRLEAEAGEGFLCREYHDLELQPCGLIDVQDAFEPCASTR